MFSHMQVNIMAFPRPVTRQTGRSRTDDSDKCSSTARESDTPGGSNTERSSGTPGTFDRDTNSPSIHITSSFLTNFTTGLPDSRLARSNTGISSSKESPLGATSKLGQGLRKSHSGVHFGGAEEPSSESTMSENPSRFLRKAASDIGMRASTPAAGSVFRATNGRYPLGGGLARVGNAHLGVGSVAEWGGVMEEGQEEELAESGNSYGPEEDVNQIQNQANGDGSNLPSPASNGLRGRGTPARSVRGAMSNPGNGTTTLGLPAPLRPFFGTPATSPGGSQPAKSSFRSLFTSDDMSSMFAGSGSGGGADGRGVGVGGVSPTGIQSPKNAFTSHGRLPSHSFGNSTIKGKASVGSGAVLGTSEDGSSESRGASPKGPGVGGTGRVGSLPPLVNPIQRMGGSKGSPRRTLAPNSSFK